MPQLDNVSRDDMGGKIDFLLNVTNMSNAQLARALSFDAIASYIEGLPDSVEGASEFDALLNSITASR